MRRLLDWFEKNGRALPWRNSRTPYSVWIAEIMLQQTVWKTVIPYYGRWMAEYPRIKVLAQADESELLRLWKGLGYYNRARNILQTARLLVNSNGGDLPDNYAELMNLPGIGKYTAAAIMSIAYGRRYPVLDANVRRVLRRVLAMARWDAAEEQKSVRLLDDIIPRKNPGTFNESLMELGQTVCLPRNPECPRCPLKEDCSSYLHQFQRFTPSTKNSKVTRLQSTVIVALWGKKILLEKREGRLLSGLWSLPRPPRNPNGDATLGRFICDQIASDYSIKAELKKRFHYYTSFSETLHPIAVIVKSPCRPEGARPLQRFAMGNNRQWVHSSKLGACPSDIVFGF